ncbi:GlxA family transcriptional regulator [Pseudomonas capsici]|uniref:GlxA family transcriptional regulator n=1 Tax=Pseudomonas capsici TaxID=2810614 RepID=A0ABT3BSE1_9PSED|nr:GlxA family transcriptional regulator [Pseudomonas capsici]MBN6715321.1 GlxA family transcriptional regulator [Pseudomonas capsici]MBN6720282.1 GlxA family transcriptional regulator [Pseudomonas capsici]MBN6725223.1 GlxA family transcriptional regulator [Pseudomonas capsici]MCV4268007.1 GlxA family transcriptional regulator [Pseudomonas capsici]MCV4276832.1 GlxA family transcriptional regulator [Pseudomonas capsici]
MADSQKTIHIVAFADVQVLDVCGPLQVFASANRRLEGLGKPPPYVMKVVAAEPGSVMSSAGLGLQTWPLPTDEPCDTLIIAGGRGIGVAMENAQLVNWIQQQAATARRMTSVCSGAFLLARTGLLDNRRVVTHWDSCDRLAKRFPSLRVDPDPIFINDGPFWTSAGVTAGIDLALALIEQDLGHSIALAVARDLVVFLKRPGGQAQFSNALSMQQASHPTENRFAELHGWLMENLDGDLSVASLAARVGMSERSFVRHYRAQTGTTPARAVEQLRVEAARRLLSESTLAIKRIASQCGFGSEETLRRSFLRALSVTPQAYRERFRC